MKTKFLIARLWLGLRETATGLVSSVCTPVSGIRSLVADLQLLTDFYDSLVSIRDHFQLVVSFCCCFVSFVCRDGLLDSFYNSDSYTIYYTPIPPLLAPRSMWIIESLVGWLLVWLVGGTFYALSDCSFPTHPTQLWLPIDIYTFV